MSSIGLLSDDGSLLPSRVGQSTLRESNLSLVAKTVFGAPPRAPMSRAAVAAATSMTRSTVSRLTDELVAGGVLRELDPPADVGPGRPGKPLVPGRGFAALGIQANASYLAAKVLDLSGTVVATKTEQGDFVGSDPGRTLTSLGRLCRSVLAEVPVDVRVIGAGLALPGIVTAQSGELMLAPNLGWSEMHVGSLLKVSRRSSDGRGDYSIRIGNEANLAAISVAHPAPGQPGPFKDFIYLSGEIGIGGALVMGGQVLIGRHGWAGELGHVCVDTDGPQCACGSTGCLERYAGREALLEAAGIPLATGPQDVGQRSRRGDAKARQSIARAAWALGVALAGVINVVDIQAVVLGGHLGLIGDELRPDLEEALRSRVLSARWDPPSIHTMGSDPAPGATGAALVELADVLNHPARWIRVHE